MLEFLQTIRDELKDDDDVLIALGEIESELNVKRRTGAAVYRCACPIFSHQDRLISLYDYSL